MQILAATDFSTRSNRALRQAGLLAQASNADLALVHVVDDDQPEALVDMEKREAERILAEQVSVMAELRGVKCRPAVASGAPFAGILQTAASMAADLIVMGSHRRQILRDIFIGTTVERVIRTGPFPVLMVNNEAQRRYERVMAAVDMSDPSANALRVARNAGVIGQRRATLLHAFLPLAKGKMFVAGADLASIGEHVASERHRAVNELTAFLAANDLNGEEWSLRVEEGRPLEVITRATREMRPDLLIMGTHGGSGLLKALIGSVTEEALRSLDVDILAVPPLRS
ncbi:MAG TPA: universal stress protein [Sphingomicrobium sp.]|nr:universal stress protein [Sphingomicrobium sp.]